MNFKTTLILILLLVLVGGYIAFDWSRDGGKAPPPPVVAQKLVTAAYNDVKSLSIDATGGDKVTLQKSGDGVDAWQVTAPYQAKADSSAVGSYIAALTAAESKGEPGAGAQGAFAPAVTVDLEGGKKVEVSSKNAVGDAVAKVSDGAGSAKWFLTDGGLVDSLTKPAASFRDTRLITSSFGEIKHLSLEHDGAKLEVNKDADEHGWSLKDGDKSLRGDDAAIGDLIQVLTGLKAAEFPAKEPAVPFNTTPLTVRFSNVSASTQPSTRPATAPVEHVVKFGRFEDARKERVIVSVDGLIAYVPGFSLNSLKKTGLDLRDKQLFADLKAGDIVGIEISDSSVAATRPDTITRLALQEGVIMPPATAPSAPRWMLKESGGEAKPADKEKVAELVSALEGLTASHFLTGDAATKPTTPWVVRLKTAKGDRELQVGESAVRFGELTFEPTVALLPLVKPPFVRPPPPPASAPATAPSTQP